MRAVMGMLLIGFGLMMAYFVLSGKFPSTAPLVSTDSSSFNPNPGAKPNNAYQKQVAQKNIGSGPTGIPTMAALNDLVASRGGVA